MVWYNWKRGVTVPTWGTNCVSWVCSAAAGDPLLRAFFLQKVVFSPTWVICDVF